MNFREAGAGDADVIVRLVNSAYRGTSAQRGWTHEAELLDGQRLDAKMLLAMLSDPQQKMFIGETAGVPECVFHLRRVGPHAAELGMLTVRPDLQARGLGRRMISFAEDFCARHWGASRIEMTVISVRAELIAYFQRRGYLLTGEERAFPVHDQRFGIAKRDDLRFVVMAKELRP